MSIRASPITDQRSKITGQSLKIEARGPGKCLFGLGAESERRWRANKLGGDGTEDRGNFRHQNRQDRRNQNRRGGRRLGTKSGMSCRANRAGVSGCGRVLGMRVGRLHRPHHAHQGDREHAHGSDESTPICQYFQHATPMSIIWRRSLDDSIVRWSLADTRCQKMIVSTRPREHGLQAHGRLQAGWPLASNSSRKLLSYMNLWIRVPSPA